MSVRRRPIDRPRLSRPLPPLPRPAAGSPATRSRRSFPAANPADPTRAASMSLHRRSSCTTRRRVRCWRCSTAFAAPATSTHTAPAGSMDPLQCRRRRFSRRRTAPCSSSGRRLCCGTRRVRCSLHTDGRRRRRRRCPDRQDRSGSVRSGSCRQDLCAPTFGPRRWTCRHHRRTTGFRADTPRPCLRRRWLDSIERRRLRPPTRCGRTRRRRCSRSRLHLRSSTRHRRRRPCNKPAAGQRHPPRPSPVRRDTGRCCAT